MAERSNAPARDGNGAIDDAADLAGGIVAQPIESFEAVPATHRDASTLDSRLDRLAQELAESRLRSEHLEATLAERASRVQQLIGERDRLVSLLAARDQEMLRLSREIGALTALQNDKRLKMAPWEPAWWQLHLEPPPVQQQVVFQGGRRARYR